MNLMCDLDLSGESNWEPIGSTAQYDYAVFSGVFDGNRHTITGLNIDSDEDNVGLFGLVDGTVRNLRVEGSVKGDYRVGGIVGDLSGGAVENCSFNGSVEGTSRVGGIIGRMRGGTEVRRCTCVADIEGEGAYVGGITGATNKGCIVEKCSFDGGTVTGSERVGGISGDADNCTVKNCFHTGDKSLKLYAVWVKKADVTFFDSVDGCTYEAWNKPGMLAAYTLASFIEEAADADQDTEITILDATTIQRFLAGYTTSDSIGKPMA